MCIRDREREAPSSTSSMRALVAVDENLQNCLSRLAQQQSRQREIEDLDKAIAEKDAALQHMANDLVQADDVLSRAINQAREPVSYTHLRAHETVLDLVCRLLLEKKKKINNNIHNRN
eukprot:TRINITY_DN29507_c0_g1_i1.p1 TRINITY_DN29507_c0_g1~~TRINITY_DN29507_c0_g1_i1.p1  ORF type:complete len:118 (+),score=57.23 TRINITY_DN29507_c0_g1_i1:201-554(+)